MLFSIGFYHNVLFSYNFKKASEIDSKFNNPIFVWKLLPTPTGLYFFPLNLSWNERTVAEKDTRKYIR